MSEQQQFIEEYITWLISSHDNVKSTTRAVEKIAEIAAVAISTAWQWKSGLRKPLSSSKKLLTIYRENANNDIPCYECSSGVYRERVMNYIFESEDGERITIPCIRQLVCDQCNDVCISMESFDEIEDYVNKYHIRRAFQELQNLRREAVTPYLSSVLNG